MLEKLETLEWFARRPSHWPHAVALIGRKLKRNNDSAAMRAAAGEWAARQAVSPKEALNTIGLSTSYVPELSRDLLDQAWARARTSRVDMGGPGDIQLIFAVTKLLSAKRIIETGVAYGWSSLAILSGIQDSDHAHLISVDMPYPKRGNEEYVGIVVPETLRKNWTLIRTPDRNGIRRAIRALGGSIDMCHYDSDKSYWGRKFAYPILWNALQPGGVFISDDIQDNFAFCEMVEEIGHPYAIVECLGKYVGISRKI